MEDIQNSSLKLNKLMIHPDFNATLEQINKLDIQLPKSSNEELDFHLNTYPTDGKLLVNVEEIKPVKLNAKNGEKIAQGNYAIIAYDESINKFSALEGTAYLTSHSLVLQHDGAYIPQVFVTFYFYTRSKSFTQKSKFIKYSTDPETDSKIDYVKDRIDFISNSTPKNSIVFIDGPLIGGQVSTYTYKLNKELLNKNAIPFFIVKNTNSNLVTDNVKELKDKFNSDLHWTYQTLKVGERTNFFKYVDQHNPRNAKLFCYIKCIDSSPQRVEFHLETYDKYNKDINNIMDLIYYLILVQGDKSNPQIRTIAIAEKYARATIKLLNVNKLMESAEITPTINQDRFGW
jgi:hypothetical protein